MALEIVRLVSEVPASVQRVWDWHVRPGALERLLPPWEPIRILKRDEGIEKGCRTTLRLGTGPFTVDWVSEHLAPEPYRSFSDVQAQGPFGCWHHRHLFSATGEAACEIEDRIEYALPCEPLGALFAGRYLRARIERGIAYRHRVVARDLALHQRVGLDPGRRVGITGASGLIGSALTHMLTTGGHSPIGLGRPSSDTLQPASLEGLQAVVHLGGEPIAAGQWTVERRRRIRDSRVDGTRMLSEALARLDSPPDVLICASAIGFYGDRGDEILDEQASPGKGFLAEVVDEWERAAEPARDAGIRVVHLRFGIVLWPAAGALNRMLTPMRACVGGPLGSGRQFWSWVSLDDAIGSVLHAMADDRLSGPVNVTAPTPLRNREFTGLLAEVLNRPAVLPVPAFALRTMLGAMADELLLASARVMPSRLTDTGYVFCDSDLEPALRHMLGQY